MAGRSSQMSSVVQYHYHYHLQYNARCQDFGKDFAAVLTVTLPGPGDQLWEGRCVYPGLFSRIMIGKLWRAPCCAANILFTRVCSTYEIGFKPTFLNC